MKKIRTKVIGIVSTPIQVTNIFELWKSKYPDAELQLIVEKNCSEASRIQILYVSQYLKIAKIDFSISKMRHVTYLHHLYRRLKQNDVIISGNWTNTNSNFIMKLMWGKDLWYVDDGLISLAYPNLPTRSMLGDNINFIKNAVHLIKRKIASGFMLGDKYINFFSLYPKPNKNYIDNNYTQLKKIFLIEHFQKSNTLIFLGGPYVSNCVISQDKYYQLLKAFTAWARAKYPNCKLEYHAHRREIVEIDIARNLFDETIHDQPMPIELRLINEKKTVKGVFTNESSAAFTTSMMGLCEVAGLVSLGDNNSFVNQTEFIEIMWKKTKRIALRDPKMMWVNL